MIKKNILANILLLTILLVPSMGHAMKRENEDADDLSAKKRQKVQPKQIPVRSGYTGPTVKLRWSGGGENDWIEMPLEEAKLSLTIKNLLDDLGGISPKNNVIPVDNVSLKTLEQVAECLTIMSESGKNNVALNLTRFLEINVIEPEALIALINAASFLDINELSDLCAQQLAHSFASHHVTLDALNNSLSGDLNNLVAWHYMSQKNIPLWLLKFAAPQAMPLGGHKDYISSVCFSTHGNTLASTLHYDVIKLWQEIDGDWKCIAQLKEEVDNDRIRRRTVAFSPVNDTLASTDTGIKLWKNIDGNWKCILSKGFGCFSICFSLDGKTLASGQKKILLWQEIDGDWTNITTLNMPKHFKSPEFLTSLCFSPDGKTMVAGTSEGNMELYREIDGKWAYLTTLKGHGNSSVMSVRFSPDGKTLASGYFDNFIKLWQEIDGNWKCIATLEDEDLIRSLCFSPDSKTLASAAYKSIKLWQEIDGNWKCVTKVEEYRVLSVCFNSDGTMLASGSAENGIKLYNLAQVKTIRHILEHKINLKQGELLNLLHDRNKNNIVDPSQKDQKRLLEIFETLPEEIKKLLICCLWA